MLDFTSPTTRLAASMALLVTLTAVACTGTIGGNEGVTQGGTSGTPGSGATSGPGAAGGSASGSGVATSPASASPDAGPPPEMPSPRLLRQLTLAEYTQTLSDL